MFYARCLHQSSIGREENMLLVELWYKCNALRTGWSSYLLLKLKGVEEVAVLQLFKFDILLSVDSYF